MNAEPWIDLQVNAYDPSGTLARGRIDLTSRASKRFALNSPGAAPVALLAPDAEVSLADWRHESVGWGLVAAAGQTLPDCVRSLVNERHATVFRYLPSWDRRLTYLRNENETRDVSIAGAPRGMGPGRLPFYLLILGGPDVVPWSLQFALAAKRAVGRLPLAGQALENYIAALRSGFAADAADPFTTVTWAVDLGASDITRLMRTHLAAKLQPQFNRDADMGPARTHFLDGMADAAQARCEALIEVLARDKPGVVVTTSHGQTGPLAEPALMRRMLGLPVDSADQALRPEALLESWRPNGAIWYCHACCSAGAEAPSAFASLFESGSELQRLLDGIAQLGPCVAPLPLALLGHERPARAFIGHVEPTFDWTLRDPGNRQVLTEPIVAALYPGLYRAGTPVGLAFRELHAGIGGYLANWDNARRIYDTGGRNLQDLLVMQLCARDLQSLVILGDPTVALALPKPAAG